MSIQAIERLLMIILRNEAWAQLSLGPSDIVLLLLLLLLQRGFENLASAEFLIVLDSFAQLTWLSGPIRITIACIWPPLLFWPFHKGTLSAVR